MNIFIDSIRNDYAGVFARAFGFLGLSDTLRASDRASIKPNLTFPMFRKGVMTNPEAVEALIVHLKNFTNRITICESDSGGYNQFSMDEVFVKTGLSAIAKRYGVRV